MPFPPVSIQTFAGAHTPQTNQATSCAIDWARKFIYIGRTGDNWISRSNILTGVEEAYTLISALNDSTQHITVTAPDITSDINGNLHVNSNNGDSIISGSALTRTSTWGAWTSSGPALPPGLPYSTINGSGHGYICTNTSTGGTLYTLACDQGGGVPVFNQAYVLRIPNFAGRWWRWVGNSIAASAGPVGTGIFYVASGGRSSPDNYPITLYKLTCNDGGTWSYSDYPTLNPQMDLQVLTTLVATDFDPTWTAVFTGGGMCLDQTDQNMLLFAAGQVGKSPRLVKIDANTGSILWNLVIPGASLPGGNCWKSNITNQRYCLALSHVGATPSSIITIDTNSGTITNTDTTGLGGLTFFGSQSFDDRTGVIMTLLDWNAITPPGIQPAGLNGSSAPFTGWAALYVAPPPPAPSHPRRFLAECGPIRLGATSGATPSSPPLPPLPPPPPPPPVVVTDITTEADEPIITEASSNLITET